MLTLFEGCTGKVEESLPLVADEVEALVKGLDGSCISIGLDERKNRDA